jgi:hypothetical protein
MTHVPADPFLGHGAGDEPPPLNAREKAALIQLGEGGGRLPTSRLSQEVLTGLLQGRTARVYAPGKVQLTALGIRALAALAKAATHA